MSRFFKRYNRLSQEKKHYLLRTLPTHLAFAGYTEQLQRVLTTLDFLTEKVRALSVQQLIDDYELSEENGLRHIQRALQLSAHLLTRSDASMESQLYGRLMTNQEPAVEALVAEITQSKNVWCRSLIPSLTQAGTPLVRALSTHPVSVTAVALAANGQILVSGGIDGTVKVWNLTQGTLLDSFSLAESPVTAVSILCSGHVIIYGDEAGSVILWDRRTGDFQAIASQAAAANRLFVTPDESHLFIAFSEQCIKLFHLETLSELFQLEIPKCTGKAVSVAPTEDLIAYGDTEGNIHIWSISTREHRVTWKAHERPIEDLYLLTKSERLLTISDSLQLKLWKYPDGNELGTLAGHSTHIIDRPTRLAATPEETIALYIGGSRGTQLKVFQIDTLEELNRITAHSWPIYDVLLAPDEQNLITAGQDAQIKIWDFRSMLQTSATGSGHEDDVISVAINGDGAIGVTGSLDGSIKIWDLATGKLRGEFVEKGIFLYGVRITSDGKQLVAGGYPARISVWDVESGAHRSYHVRHHEAATGFTLAADFSHILSFSPHELLLWDIRDGQILNYIVNENVAIGVVTTTQNLEYAIVSYSDNTIRIIDLRTGSTRILHGHRDKIAALAILPQDHFCVSASYDGTLKLWDIQRGAWIHNFARHQSSVRDIAVIPGKQRRVISASNDQTLIIWDIDSGEPISVLQGHTDSVFRVVVSSDGQVAASLSNDETSILWDLAMATPITTFSGENRFVDCALSPDAKVLILGEMGGAVHILHLNVPST